MSDREISQRVEPVWAKRDFPYGWLGLVEHAMDVASVVEELLRLPRVVAPLERHAAQPLHPVAVARLAFLAGLHDAGKACREFQAFLLWGPRAEHTDVLWNVVGTDSADGRVSALSACVRAALGCDRRSFWFSTSEVERVYWGAVLSHHAPLPFVPLESSSPASWSRSPSGDPCARLHRLVTDLERVLPQAFVDDGSVLPSGTDFHGLFGKVVKYADQLASASGAFPLPATGVPFGLQRYWWARGRARDVVARSGLVDELGQHLADFSLFGGRMIQLPSHRWWFSPKSLAA